MPSSSRARILELVALDLDVLSENWVLKVLALMFMPWQLSTSSVRLHCQHGPSNV